MEKIWLSLLAQSSKVAFKHINDDFEIINVNEETTFHPNGFCGAILLNDEYFFNLRCNHLMFADGYLEEDSNLNNHASVYIYGNHKGTFNHFIIRFKKPNDK